MTVFSGSAMYLAWVYPGGTVTLHGDYRQFDWTPTLSLLDSTAGADAFREYLSGVGEGGDIGLSCVMQGDGTALIGALGRGNEGTIYYGPEGTAVGAPRAIIPAISKGPAYSQPFDDITEFKVAWQQSAAETIDTWGYESYIEKIEALTPLAYWPMNEPSGSVMNDIVGGYDGAYGNITLGQTGIGDGETSALFNGSSSYGQISGANLTALAAALDWDEFTIMCWLKVSGAGVWTDGAQRRQIYFGSGTDEANNHFYLRKNTTSNQTRCGRAGTTLPHIAVDHTISTTDWFHVCMTSSKAADQLKFFVNGAQTGSTYNSLATILGTLAVVVFGTYGGTYFWSGYMAHAALFNRALTPAEVALAGAV